MNIKQAKELGLKRGGYCIYRENEWFGPFRDYTRTQREVQDILNYVPYEDAPGSEATVYRVWVEQEPMRRVKVPERRNEL